MNNNSSSPTQKLLPAYTESRIENIQRCLYYKMGVSLFPEFDYLIAEGLFDIKQGTYDNGHYYHARDFFGILNILPFHQELLVEFLLDSSFGKRKIVQIEETEVFELLFQCGYISYNSLAEERLLEYPSVAAEVILRYG